MKLHQASKHRLFSVNLFLACLLAAGGCLAQFKDTFADGLLGGNSAGTGTGFTSNGQMGVSEAGGAVTMSGSGYATMVIRSNDTVNPYQTSATTTTWRFGTITYEPSWQRFWVGYRIASSNNDHFYPDNPNLQGLYISIISNTGAENNYTYKGNLVAHNGTSRTILASWDWSNLNQLSNLVVSLTTTSTTYSLSFSGATATPTYTFGAASGTLTGIGSTSSTFRVGVHNQSAGGSTVQVAEIENAPANASPTDITLTPSSIAENNTANATVGTLAATDSDTSQTHTFSLVSGTGSTDNASFTISGTSLKLTPAANYEVKNSYSVRVKADDGNGGTFEKALTVSITDVAEAAGHVVTGNAVDIVNEDTTPSTTDNTQFGNIGSGSVSKSFVIKKLNSGVLDLSGPSPDFVKLGGADASQFTVSKQPGSTTLGDFVTVANAGFESPVTSGFIYTPASSGWVFGASTGVARNGSAFGIFSCPEGSQGGIVQSGGQLNQSLSFPAPAVYEITFSILGRPSLGPNDVDIDVDGTVLGTVTAAQQSQAEWRSFTVLYDCTAAGAHTLSFKGKITTLDRTSFIDDVKVRRMRTQFTVTYQPKVSGSHSATVSIPGNDPAIPSYSFAIQGSMINGAATDIVLSSSSIQENNAVNAVVGILSAKDPDVGQTHVFSLVAGAGDTDNASFGINGDVLSLKLSADYETRSSYSLRVQADDGQGGVFARALTVTVLNVNEVPADIGLSSSVIVENNAVGATVGSFSATDPDAASIHTFSLVAGAGDTGNAAFSIVGGVLKMVGTADFETKPAFSIRVRATDAGGLYVEKNFTISVKDVNEAPTSLKLSAASIAENSVAGTVIGSLAATDADAGDSFTYTLASGVGGDDNSSFTISGSTLKTAAVLDYETKSTRLVRVRVTDSGGQTLETAFVLSVTNVNEAPTDIALPFPSLPENSAAGAVVSKITAVDPDAGSSLTFSLASGVGGADNASFSVSGFNLLLVASANYEAKSTYNLRLRVTDEGGLSFEKALVVTITDEQEATTDIQLSKAVLAENNAAGVEVGVLAAVDPDVGVSYSYTLVAGQDADDNASFSISGSSLLLGVKANFETRSSYKVRVKSNDGRGGVFEKAFTIAVTDSNDAPVFTNNGGLATARLDTLENKTLVTTVVTTDEDLPEQTVSYSLIGLDSGLFSINNETGVLSFNAEPDFETPGDLDADNVYQVTVVARDSGSPAASSSQVLSITVKDVTEYPEIAVLGAGSEIVSGDSEPTPLDSTDFGNVAMGESLTRTFVISNTDYAPLRLTGLPLVAVSGENVGNFLVTVQPSALIAPKTGQTSFKIRFSPSGSGLRTALVTVRSNDVSEGVYTFAIQGTGTSNNAGRVFLASTAYSVDQGASQVVVRISRADGKAETSIRLTTTDGTADATFSAAVAGEDYTAVNTLVNFPLGVMFRDVTIPITPKSGIRPNLRFNITLSSPGPRTILATPSTAVVSIVAFSRPVVTMVNPKADGNVVSMLPYVVSGTVTNPGKSSFDRVEVKLNNNAPVLATLSTNPKTAAVSWSAPISPVNGANVLTVTGVDGRGIPSLPTVANFSFTASRLLTARGAGNGLVTGSTITSGVKELISNGVGRGVVPGAKVELKAVFGKTSAQVFSHWSGLPVGSTTLGMTASFNMPDEDLPDIQAVFVNSPFATGGLDNTYYGLIQAIGVYPETAANTAFITGTLLPTGAFSGKLTYDSKIYPLVASFYGDGSSVFGTTTQTKTYRIPSGPDLSLSFSNGDIQAALKAGSIVQSQGIARRSPYTKTNGIAAELLNSKAALTSIDNDQAFFSFALPAKAQTNGRAVATYPQGDGFGTIVVTAAGKVTVSGLLADGSSFTFSGAVLPGDVVPFFANPVNGLVFQNSNLPMLAGQLVVNNTLADSDITAADMVWTRPVVSPQTGTTPMALGTQLYSQGWPGGIRLDAVGALYDKAIAVQSSLGLGAASATQGNGELFFSDGKLLSSIRHTNFNIVGSTVTKIPATFAAYTLSVAASSASFSGTFTPNWTNPAATKPSYKGVILQKGMSKGGYGYFISNRTNDIRPEAGRVTLGTP